MAGRGQQAPLYRVGTSGWHYDHWRDRFYPRGLPKSRWLAYYAQHFSTVEINASFYRLPSENAWRAWRAQTPPGFVFAAKVSRFITHYRRLLGVAEPLATFLHRARLLGDKLGPVLYQLPPDLPRDDERLRAFVAQLPTDIRHVVEFRHASWWVDPVFAILERYGAGFCVVDMVGMECPLVATAPFVYLRFHGKESRYRSRYGEGELAGWAQRIRSLGVGRQEAYAYFNNDAEAHAVYDARSLRNELLSEADR
jgi:uncharacterized protein YecE (DUF72 family)